MIRLLLLETGDELLLETGDALLLESSTPSTPPNPCATFSPTLTADWEFGSRAVSLYANLLAFVNAALEPLSFTNRDVEVVEFSGDGQELSKANVAGVFGHYLGWTIQGEDAPFRLETVAMEYAPMRVWDTSP